MKKWTGYFDKLLNGDSPAEESPRLKQQQLKASIQYQLNKKRFKVLKFPGKDGINADILKKIDETIILKILKLVKMIWKK